MSREDWQLLNDTILSLAITVFFAAPIIYIQYQRPERTYGLLAVLGVLLLAAILDRKGNPK